MRISVVCVGRLKEKYWKLAEQEYSKRLQRYAKFEILEASDEKAPECMSVAEQGIVRLKEGERILKNIHSGSFVVALAVDGKSMDSEYFSQFFEDKMNQGISHITFVIGGSIGLSKQVLERADVQLSFSEMTFPHQLMRIILLEQIYRAFKIIKNEPYHK